LDYYAKIINYTEATEFIYEENRVVGANVKDTISGKNYAIKSKYVINACVS
jgi:glycerol-3-phosphate dehydrogenase